MSLTIPRGQISTFSLFFLSAYFGHLSSNSEDNTSKIGFMIAMFILIFFGIFVYGGWIPCKERLASLEERINKGCKKQ
jgi:CHASE2 domain-containing sensor protein